MWRLLRFLPCALLAACCTQRGDLHDPVLETNIQQFVCVQNITIDSENRVWLNGGCESDNDGSCHHQRGVIDALTRADLERRIAEVAPQSFDGSCNSAGAGEIDSYTLSDSRTGSHSRFCRASASMEANALVDELQALLR